MTAFCRQMLLEPGNIIDGFVVNELDQGRPAFVYLLVSNILGDGEGLQKFWSSKGPSGVFPCILCLNVCGCGQKSLASDDAEEYIVDISEHRARFMQLSTNEDIWDKADVLTSVEGRVKKGTFKNLQTQYGMNYNPAGVLWRKELRPHLPPVDVHTYDPTHTFLADGSINTECDFLVARLHAQGISFKLLSERIGADSWQLPMHVSGAASRLRDMFSDRKANHYWKDGGHKLSLTPSDMMLFVPLVAHTVETLNLPCLRLETQSIVCCNAVLRTLRAAKLGEDVADRMERGIEAWAEAYGHAYGAEDYAYKPKWHFGTHIARQIRRDGLALDTFVTERKQSCLKTASEFIENASHNSMVFERSVLARFLQLHKELLNRAGFLDGLIEGSPCPELAERADVAHAWMSKRIRWQGCTVSAKDVAFVDDRAYVVLGGCKLEDEFSLLAFPCTRVGQVVGGDQPRPRAGVAPAPCVWAALAPLVAPVSTENPQVSAACWKWAIVEEMTIVELAAGTRFSVAVAWSYADDGLLVLESV